MIRNLITLHHMKLHPLSLYILLYYIQFTLHCFASHLIGFTLNYISYTSALSPITLWWLWGFTGFASTALKLIFLEHLYDSASIKQYNTIQLYSVLLTLQSSEVHTWPFDRTSIVSEGLGQDPYKVTAPVAAQTVISKLQAYRFNQSATVLNVPLPFFCVNLSRTSLDQFDRSNDLASFWKAL